MGIQGLLPLLKSIMVPMHIKDLESCTVAVDTYSWLHKGALSCSIELCKGLPTTRHIDYCMRRVNLLQHYGVRPILVFDGGLLPMKSEQENKRARARKENLARAIEHESNGNVGAAFECYQKAVDISPSIAYQLIQVLKQENVSYIVAPYEADAQMAFLAVSEQVNAVITEDSDLIPFGCPRIIFKMDKFGHAVEFQNSMLHKNKDLSFTGFTKQMLLEMCILSGCDYLQSLAGMGLKRAHALIKKFGSYDKVIKHLRYSTASVPPLYEESFKKAILTFQHQRVYDPTVEGIVHLTGLPDYADCDLDFLGPMIPQHIAKDIARGDIDPLSRLPFQENNDTTALVRDGTHLLKSYKSEIEKKKLDLPAQKNLLTNYFCFASLEAKRKFRAPRVSPKQPELVAGASGFMENLTKKASLCQTSSYLIELENSVALKCKELVCEVEDDIATIPETPETESSNPGSKVLDGSKRNPEDISLQHSRHFIHRPCLLLNKGHEIKPIVEVECKRIEEKRGVIVRSPYFQHKTVNKENISEKLSDPKDFPITTLERTNYEYSSSRHSPSGGMIKKRKGASLNAVRMENAESKNKRANVPNSRNISCNDSVDGEIAKTKFEDGKFGCNISHLGQYSGIAEKSMEKFVSVISSFRFSSSDSRAGGLRSPLKDVRNTCTARSNMEANLSKYSYAPSNKGMPP